MEAMRSTEPGGTEYQLDAVARYVFFLHDARLEKGGRPESSARPRAGNPAAHAQSLIAGRRRLRSSTLSR